jgi:hypothetical protein
VKQADLHVGDEYALPTYKPYDSAPLGARVSVVSVDGAGKVTVRVVDPGVTPPGTFWNARVVKRNEKLQVSTREIACPWDEWADHAAAIGAEKETQAEAQRVRHEKYKHERADRLIVDPGRPLPAKYDEDEDYFDPESDAEERLALSKAYSRARGLGPHTTADELRPLLADLPVPVLRDVLGADRHWRSGPPGTVAATFTRAAGVLDEARVASAHRSGRGHIPQPGRLLGETDVAFVSALREQIAAAGGELLLPPVPLLPQWIEEE